METITVSTTVKGVRLSKYEDKTYYSLVLADNVPCLAKDKDDVIESETNVLTFSPRQLAYQLINVLPGFDVLYLKKKESEGFGAAEYAFMLKDARIGINRIRFDVGDKYVTEDGNEEEHEYAGYSTEITSVEVRDVIQRKLDKYTEDLF